MNCDKIHTLHFHKGAQLDTLRRIEANARLRGFIVHAFVADDFIERFTFIDEHRQFAIEGIPYHCVSFFEEG